MRLFVKSLQYDQNGCLCRPVQGTCSVQILHTCRVELNNKYATWFVEFRGRVFWKSGVKFHALRACGKTKIRHQKCERFIYKHDQTCMYVLNPMMVVTSHGSAVLPTQYESIDKPYPIYPEKGVHCRVYQTIPSCMPIYRCGKPTIL